MSAKLQGTQNPNTHTWYSTIQDTPTWTRVHVVHGQVQLGPLSGLESHGSVSFAARGSFARAGPLSGPESHGSVSFAARRSLARAGPLSGLESHGSVSFAVRCSFAPAWPLSDPESHGSVSFAVRGQFVRVESLSGLAFPTLIALPSDPRSSPTRQ